MEINLEQTILRNILTNDQYMRKVIPFLKIEYFTGTYRALFKESTTYVQKYNKLPTLETFKIELDLNEELNDERYSDIVHIVPEIFRKEEIDNEWLIDKTEEWCQSQAIHNAIMESITIIDGRHESLTKNSLPDLLQSALAVTFDTSVGHDYIEDMEKRFEFYHRDHPKIPFDIDYLNQITGGGLYDKTLNLIMASTGVGKSLVMCHMAAAHMAMGYDVLYITAEMSEERIAERIDANLMNVPIGDIENLSREAFNSKLNNIAKQTAGKLIIKEYPTGAANANHFRSLLNELKLKKAFRPQIIYIDYLNICSSARMKGVGGSVGSYNYIKSIAEELRGLAVEYAVPIVSATQSNRDGYKNSDVDLSNTSESFGLPATTDLFLAIVSNDELESMGQIMWIQLKNRYGDVSNPKRFVTGIDKSRMRIFDVEETEQTLSDESQLSKDRDWNVKDFDIVDNGAKKDFSNFKI